MFVASLNEWESVNFTRIVNQKKLKVFADGAYLELIAFTHPTSRYTPESEEFVRRDRHPWATKSPGWIDYAFLGNGSQSDSISEIINQRARKDGSGVFYEPEQEGGRSRPDGQVVKWLISFPRQGDVTGTPFFCGDVTPRYLRVCVYIYYSHYTIFFSSFVLTKVPIEPPENVQHPSGAAGIAYLHILVQPTSFNAVSDQLKTVIGDDPISSTRFKSIWSLDTTNLNVEHLPQLILSIPKDDEETAFIKGSITEIYEVGFRVHQGSKRGNMSPRYGRIAWC